MAINYLLAGIDAEIGAVHYRLAAVDAISGGTSYLLGGLDAEAGQEYQVTLGENPPRFDPFDIAVLTASAYIVPESWLFQEISGFGGTVITPTVVLSGAAGQRFYRCPGRLTEQTKYFRVTATFAGGATDSAEVRHTIAPHAGDYGPGDIGRQYHPTPNY